MPRPRQFARSHLVSNETAGERKRIENELQLKQTRKRSAETEGEGIRRRERIETFMVRNAFLIQRQKCSV